MGITINTLHRVDDCDDRHYGTVTHNGHTFNVVLVGPFDRLQLLVNRYVTAEYELQDIISVDSGLDLDESLSGLFSLGADQIAVDGSIHNVITIDHTSSLLDIYIQNGADFVAVSTDHIGLKPPLGTRIRIVGKGLHVYPTFT